MRLIKKLVGLAVLATIISNNPGILERWGNSVKEVLASQNLNSQASVIAPITGEKSALVSYNSHGQAFLWRTCDPVKVLVNDGGDANNYQVIAKALNRAKEVTGVDFQIVSKTEETPVYDWYKRGGIPPVIIGVVDRTDLLGTANAVGTTVANPAGPNIVTGAIALRKSYFETHSLEKRYEVTLHEIGHLIGLQHSDNQSDLMYKSTTENVKTDFSDDEINFFNKNKSCSKR